MKKKFIILIVSIIFIIIMIFAGLFIPKRNTVNMSFAKKAEVFFKHESTNIDIVLSEQELSSICDICDGKEMYRDNPSCSFSEDVAIKFNDKQTFCLARDTCPIIYWKEKDKYFNITEEEKEKLYSILEYYGIYFPCV